MHCDITPARTKVKLFHLRRWAQITLYQKRNATKRNDLFNQQKRSATSAINFLIQLKRNAIPQLWSGVFVPSRSAGSITSAIEISQHKANTAFFATLDQNKIKFNL